MKLEFKFNFSSSGKTASFQKAMSLSQDQCLQLSQDSKRVYTALGFDNMPENGTIDLTQRFLLKFVDKHGNLNAPLFVGMFQKFVCCVSLPGDLFLTFWVMHRYFDLKYDNAMYYYQILKQNNARYHWNLNRKKFLAALEKSVIDEILKIR